MEEWIYFLLFGAVAGWIASTLMKGRGFGLVGNIIVGIVGSALGGWLSKATGIAAGSGLIGSLATAVVGAVVLLGLISIIKKA
ncbi:MAG: GlsB/YeaQ/YmgE family stress response membrane protein [Saprospiraceae bacterium]